MPKSTRFGRKRCCCSTMKAMSCCCPRPNKIPSDFYRKGETARAVVACGQQEQQSKIILSRTSPVFLQHLVRDGECPNQRDCSSRELPALYGERAADLPLKAATTIIGRRLHVGVKGSRIHGDDNVYQQVWSVIFAIDNQLFVQRPPAARFFHPSE